jgi:ACS family hexuronate transporter-like MFS transporter
MTGGPGGGLREERARGGELAPLSATVAEPGLDRYRWTICALLFFATTINYIDRQVLGILAPTLQRELGWSEAQYGAIVSWFTLAYALGFLVAGRLMDRFGVKKGFTGAIITWSLAAMGHAFAATAAGFSAARFALGLGESANFPGSIKTVAEWFPPRERAFATGIFNAGTNVGAIITPLVVPWITLTWGWRAAFLVTGALGFIWLTCWLVLYRSPTERADVPAEAPATRIPWIKLLGYRQTWAVIAAKGLTDPVWWFYLFWLPKFLDARYGIKLAGLAAPLIVIYLIADVGSVGGGWLSAPLVKRGWSLNRARKTAMLIPALLIVPTMLAPSVNGLWIAVLIVGVAAAAHQWWMANVYTLSSDMFPRHAVGSVTGIGGFAGAASGFVFQRFTGQLLQANHNDYRPIFIFCGLAYVIAWVIIQLLVPRLQPIDDGASPRA